MLLRKTLLRLGDEPRAFFVDLPGDGQLQLLLLSFELSLPLAHREFEASSLFEIFRLILHLVLQPSEFLRDSLLRLLRRICLRALQVLFQPALVFRAQLALAVLQRYVETACSSDASISARKARVSGDLFSTRRARESTGRPWNLFRRAVIGPGLQSTVVRAA